MNLSGLLGTLRGLPEYQAALAAVRAGQAGGPGLALRLLRAARIPVAAALSQEQAAPRWCRPPDRATTVAEELTACPQARVLSFNEPNPSSMNTPGGPRTIRPAERAGGLAGPATPQPTRR
jgi:hypothetical protein